MTRFPSLLQAIRVLACLCIVPWIAAAEDEDPVPYNQTQDVVYGEVHGTGLLMDVFTPKAKTNGLAMVDVASGAWYSDRGKIRDHTLAQMYQTYCERGYTVFAVRPGSKTRYTILEMEANLKTGIRYIKQNAAKYHIDPERLGMTGASAGGHLATLASLRPLAAKPDSKKPAERFSTAVKAVGVFFPPTDLVEWEPGKPSDEKLLRSILYLPGVTGQSEADIQAAARKASPLHSVVRTEVPYLLIHGSTDPVVPLSHSERFVEAIKKAEGSAELIVKPGGGHAWLTLPQEVAVMADWFDKKLGVVPAKP